MINRWISVTGWIWESCWSMVWFVFPSSCLGLLSSWNPAEQWRLLIRVRVRVSFWPYITFFGRASMDSQEENARCCQNSVFFRLTWRKMGFVWKLALWRRAEKGKEERMMVKIVGVPPKAAPGMLMGLNEAVSCWGHNPVSQAAAQRAHVRPLTGDLWMLELHFGLF